MRFVDTYYWMHIKYRTHKIPSKIITKRPRTISYEIETNKMLLEISVQEQWTSSFFGIFSPVDKECLFKKLNWILEPTPLSIQHSTLNLSHNYCWAVAVLVIMKTTSFIIVISRIFTQMYVYIYIYTYNYAQCFEGPNLVTIMHPFKLQVCLISWN